MSAHSHLLVCAICIILVILACIAAGCSSYKTPATTAPPVSATAPVSTAVPVSSGAPASTGGVNSISIKNFAFNPSSLTVKTGSVVTWVNQDGTVHTIVSDPGSPLTFSSDPLQTGASFTVSFTQPGKYTYHCSIHPSMTGTIVVQS